MHDIVLEVLISNFDVIINKIELMAQACNLCSHRSFITWKLVFLYLPMAKQIIRFRVAILFFVGDEVNLLFSLL